MNFTNYIKPTENIPSLNTLSRPRLEDIFLRDGYEVGLRETVKAIENRTLSCADLMELIPLISKDGGDPIVVSLYKTWLDAMGDTAGAVVIWFNFGCALKNLNMLTAAEEAFRKTISKNPALYQASHNLGLTLEAQGKPNEAISTWLNAIQDDDSQTALLNQAGRASEIQRDYGKAEELLLRSLLLNPNQQDVIQHWVHIRQKMCLWPAIMPLHHLKADTITSSIGSMAALAELDDPALHLKTAKEYVARKVIRGKSHLSPKSGYGHKKIRIGYMSSDFRLHAVSILTAELFERHNRDEFEVYGFCFSQNDNSALRQRVVSAFDHYIPLHHLDDESSARLIRSHEIDILFDLNGLTSNARPNILTWKPAPVQIAYLGFVGSSAIPEVDFILADEYIYPNELQAHFTEKPLYMPRVFQINNQQRRIGKKPTRQECKLPREGFVFCNFNNSYKITPTVFSGWMNILAQAPGSVLWLLEDNPWHKDNLLREAAKHGIDPGRLIFAGRIQPEEYLARFQVADLMLDTYPYNAGTTASDALWAGLPILTLSGKSLVSRMAGSLLKASHLSDLISHSQEEYEEKAVSIANSPTQLEGYKKLLRDNNPSNALYDSGIFTKELEKILKEIVIQKRTQATRSEQTI